MLKSVYAFVAISACTLLVGCGESSESDYAFNAKQSKGDTLKTNTCFALIDPYCENDVSTSDVAEYVVNVVQSSTSIEQGKPFPGCGSTNDNQVLIVKCHDSTSVRYMCMGSIRSWTIFPDSKACSEKDETLMSSSSVNMSSAVSVDSPESSDRSEESSSSESVAKACKTETEDNCEYGLLVDARNGKKYKTIKIGEQVWMAENLKYKVNDSYCYNESADSCAKYGRLYLWTAAVGEKECGRKKCGLSGTVRGICPEGWHLPDNSEWNILYSAIGKSRYAMQAKGVKKWPDATDAYGFTALPAGERSSSFKYDEIGLNAYFWSATENNVDDAYYWYVSTVGADLWFMGDKLSGRSVRCIQDSQE